MVVTDPIDYSREAATGKCVVFDDSLSRHICWCRFRSLSVSHTLRTNVDNFYLRDITDGVLARYDVYSTSAGKQLGTFSEHLGFTFGSTACCKLTSQEEILLAHALGRVRLHAPHYSRNWAA